MDLADKIFLEITRVTKETGKRPTVIIIHPYTVKEYTGPLGQIIRFPTNKRPEAFGVRIYQSYDIDEGEIIVK